MQRHTRSQARAAITVFVLGLLVFVAGCGDDPDTSDGSAQQRAEGETTTSDGNSETSPRSEAGAEIEAGAEAGSSTDVPSGPEDLPEPQSPGDHIVYQFIAGFTEMTELLATVTDSTSALKVAPQLQLTVQKLRQIIPLGEALSDEERAATNAKYSDRLQRETQRFAAGLQRASAQPGASAILSNAISALDQ